MSTPEQPATPALTRKQLRDMRNTGATPIVSADAPAAPVDDAAIESVPESTAESTQSAETSAETVEEVPAPVPAAPPAAPLPRAAVPVAVHDLPGADANVDLGVAPLTRRQARQQERIRTASVPVITPEVAAGYAADAEPVPEVDSAEPPADSDDATGHDEIVELLASAEQPAEHDEDAAHDEPVHDEPAHEDAAHEDASHDEPAHEEPAHQDAAHDEPVHDEPAHEDAAHDESVHDESVHDDAVDEGDRATVHPQFGAGLLAGESTHVDLPPSFDQLITRSVTGAIGTGNALILSQTPSAPPLVAPVAATGEVLITGSFDLPEGLGSTGHANGTADGKEVDAVLIDGELPAHSSPTPIAASAAISTVKNGGDIIRPPAPEKGGRLMLTLAITAGVLALALVGVLILAFVTGVF